MAEGDVVSIVQSLGGKLSSDPAPSPQKILRILQKLSDLPISFHVLDETGIGKVVNGFRKHEGEVAEMARNLVRDWKEVVRVALDQDATRQETTDAQNQGQPQPQPQPQSQPQPQPQPQSQPRQDSKPYSPSKHQGPQSQSSQKSPRTPKPHSPAKLESSAERQSPSQSAKTKILPKSTCTSLPHSPSKSLSSSKHSTELKRHPADSGMEYTHLKEKHSSASGSPVKKFKSHHSPGSGTAKVQDKRETVTSATPKSHISSEKRAEPDAHKPHNRSRDQSHDRSRDKSHGRVPTSGEKKSAEDKPAPQGLNLSSHEKHHSTSSKKAEVREKISKDKPVKTSNLELKSEPSLKETAASVVQERSTPNGNAMPNKPTPAKIVEGKSSTPSVSRSSDKEKTKPKVSSPDQEGFKKPASKPSSNDKKPKVENARDDDLNDDKANAKNYSNTGMSFGDCLLGPMVTKVKKVTKGKASESSKLSSKTSAAGKVNTKSSSTKAASSDPGRSKVKHGKPDPSKAKVKVDGSKHGKSSGGDDKGLVSGNRKEREAGKGESSSKGQSSDAGQRSEAGRRHRKKRSMSEEEEEAIKMAKKVRIESSEVSLSLPEIQPNYKPMRLPEVVSPSKKRTLTAEEEMAFLGSKQGRTKVFSGRSRLNRLTSVPRLYDICMDILCDNINALDEVGGVPYDILCPVLQRCTPQQLFHLEDCNPHFLEDTDPLWQKHTERDFKGRRPGELESWRELYIREHDAREARLKSITANISAQMAAKDPGRLTKMAFIDRPAKPPRNVMRQQLRHGTASGSFVPEKRSHSSVQPHRPAKVVINSSGADVSGFQRRQARRKRRKLGSYSSWKPCSTKPF